jgi:hypothetical protein
MRFAKSLVIQLVLIVSTLLISNTATGRYIGASRFQTFEDLALFVGKLQLDRDAYTGGAVTINGGIQYSVLGIYLGLGPALFVPDRKNDQKEWTNYIGGIATAGVMLRIPLKRGMILAGNEFILGKSYQPIIGYLFRGQTRHTGIFATATIGSSVYTYYAVGARMTLGD